MHLWSLELPGNLTGVHYWAQKRRIRRGFQSLNRSRKNVEVINRIAMDNDGIQVSSRQGNEIEIRNFCWIISEIDFKSLKLAPALVL